MVNSTVESVIAEDTVSGAISLKEKMDYIVKENVKKKQERRQRVANQAPFSVGQKVLRKNIRTQQRKGGKLESFSPRLPQIILLPVSTGFINATFLSCVPHYSCNSYTS